MSLKGVGVRVIYFLFLTETVFGCVCVLREGRVQFFFFLRGGEGDIRRLI